MWLIAFSLYAGCKWLTWWTGTRCGHPSLAKSLAYLLLWPGMDFGTFVERAAVRPPLRREWLEAIAAMLAGTTVVWVICRFIPPVDPLLAGWIGMIGLVLLLHFGLFHLLALLWQWMGVNAQPLMDHPLRSRSIGEFWGRRWNTAFHELAHRLAFRPLSRIVGAPVAMLAGFVISGLIHDLVISVPAGGGFGLPTGYFTLQGLGVLAERQGLFPGNLAARRLIAWAFIILPAYWLFHPLFVLRVILPFLSAIHAIPTMR